MARTRDYAAEYARRIERAKAKGLSRQAARGHKPGESARRREREKREKGATSDQIRSVKKWYNEKFNPPSKTKRKLRKGEIPKPTYEQIEQLIRDVGIDKFREYQREWNKKRGKYVKDYEKDEYKSGGMNVLDEKVTEYSLPNIAFFYYH